jgi:hypothetical protein
MAYKMRVHWFADRMTREDAEHAHLLCTNGTLAAIRENDLKAFLNFKLKEYAYWQVMFYRDTYLAPNDWINYPEETDDPIDLAYKVQYFIPTPAAGC